MGTVEPFATVLELSSYWRELSTEEGLRAADLLVRASATMRLEMGRSGVSWDDPSPEFATVLSTVCMDVVRRAMDVPEGMGGVDTYSQGAVGYSESFKYANPGGDLFLKASERRALGIGRARVGSAVPWVEQ